MRASDLWWTARVYLIGIIFVMMWVFLLFDLQSHEPVPDVRVVYVPVSMPPLPPKVVTVRAEADLHNCWYLTYENQTAIFCDEGWAPTFSTKVP